uniref:Uncharacterized protein n=1 Tax=Candidatus Kentrum sp. DK TaxID=2126562 RepID=A0A450T8L1_9GAMM|nr:MAG: hypothetical protein BECKDK2373B_GA0170837_111814 [Candidatus Kentron sp. DK]
MALHLRATEHTYYKSGSYEIVGAIFSGIWPVFGLGVLNLGYEIVTLIRLGTRGLHRGQRPKPQSKGRIYELYEKVASHPLTALKTSSKCSFIPYKLRFLVSFRLVMKHDPTLAFA